MWMGVPPIAPSLGPIPVPPIIATLDMFGRKLTAERLYSPLMAQNIQFLGAAETVTGSRHLLTLNGRKVLVDCGLFQGDEALRQRNWEPFPIAPEDLDAIVITHAHLDHIGYLPRLVRNGYRGPIYATSATIQLARISLPDSGRLQEEDARFANKHGFSNHQPALPLYTEEESYAALKLFQSVHYHQFHQLPGGAQFQFLPAGHILGSAYAEIYFDNGERILMSGDLGRFDTPIIKDPTTIEFAEYLVLESTYGDRLHAQEDAEGRLMAIIKDAVDHGSVVLVPSFAIGRTQELLYFIHQLQDKGAIPRIPIFVDSPMANSSTLVYGNAIDEFDQEMKLEISEGHTPLKPDYVEFIRDANQSKALNSRGGPMMIIAGSGMCNGGRIVHHLRHRLDDPSTVVLFSGYQAQGTLGRKLIDHEPEVKIHGVMVPVRARIEALGSLSAHADYGEILKWLEGFKTPPKRTFIVHGEPPAQASLKEKIEAKFGWNVVIPKWLESFELA